MSKQQQEQTNQSARKMSKDSHILFRGNPRVIIASREAIGAMKYKGE